MKSIGLLRNAFSKLCKKERILIKKVLFYFFP